MGLNASDELIAIRNRNILLANGFDVRQGEVRPMIHAMPYSKSTAFKLSGKLKLYRYRIEIDMQ